MPGTPLFASTLANLCRVLTISAKDIIEEHPDFSGATTAELFQFLRHVRNAAAHENRFYFGVGKQRGQDPGWITGPLAEQDNRCGR